jgi:hypothetical protein
VKPYERLLAAMGVRVETLPSSELARAKLAPGLLVVPLATARTLTPDDRQAVLRAADAGALVIAEGATPLTEALGIVSGGDLEVTTCEELAHPGMPITWPRPVRLPTLVLPQTATTLTVEARTRRPVAASIARGKGRFVVLATLLDADDGGGFGRFPFLPQVLLEAGLKLPLRSPRLAAFFDYGYRDQADLEALARRWHAAGINQVHVGAWDFWDPAPVTDAYLERLLAAAHAEGIQVYAWLELPHVSTDFWQKHPAWREKTATLADAHLDWRYLVNLMNPDCAKAVKDGVTRLVTRFDWDGVNLSELYFDSPMGPSDPAQLTPFNDEARRAYRKKAGIDPVAFFDVRSPHHWKKDAAAWGAFVDWRVEVERDLNQDYLELLERVRDTQKPHLGVTLTYVDNLYDPSMREAVGADVKVILPMLDTKDFVLVIEDPMTTWHLGPERYSELASSYGKLTRQTSKLGVDINIVDRAAPVFPTAKQTGGEIAALLYHAGKSYETVMIYAEQSIEDHDLPLVAPALAAAAAVKETPAGLVTSTRVPLSYRGLPPGKTARLDDRDWPAQTADEVALPVGEHTLTLADAGPTRPHLVELNAALRDARYVDGAIEVTYRAVARGYARFDATPSAVTVDGKSLEKGAATWLALPRGEHVLRAEFATVEAAHHP